MRINARVATGTERLGIESLIGNMCFKVSRRRTTLAAKDQYLISLADNEVTHVLRHGVAPGTRRRPGERSKFRSGENRIHRPARDKVLHVGEFDWRDCSRFQRHAEFVTAIDGVLRILLPAALVGIGEVQNALETARPRAVRRGDAPAPITKTFGKHLRDVKRVSGGGEFVRARVNMLVFARALNDRVNKTRPIRAEDP